MLCDGLRRFKPLGCSNTGLPFHCLLHADAEDDLWLTTGDHNIMKTKQDMQHDTWSYYNPLPLVKMHDWLRILRSRS